MRIRFLLTATGISTSTSAASSSSFGNASRPAGRLVFQSSSSNRIQRLLALLSLVIALAWPGDSNASPLKVGQPFPDLILPTIESPAAENIGSHFGKKTLMLIFASW